MPRWYFGWNIVAAAALVTLLTVGMRMGIGPFFLPIADDLGFSRSLLAGIVAVGMLTYGLAMPLAGYLVARKGTRFVLLIGTAMVAVSVVWTVLARDAIGFALAFGVLMSVGLAFTSPVALTPVISRWFTRRRGMALFLLSTGSMAGIAAMTPLLTSAIAAMGWRTTLLGFGTLFCLLTVPAALFVIRDRAPPGTDLQARERSAHAATPAPAAAAAEQQTMRFAEAVRTVPFLQVCFGLFACGFSMNLLGTHGMPMLMDHGFDATTSSLGIGVIGLVAIFSTVVLGRLSDSVDRRPGVGRQRGHVLGHPGRRLWRAPGGHPLRLGLRRPPGWRLHQLLARWLGLRGVRHALDRLRHRRRAAHRRRRGVAATAPQDTRARDVPCPPTLKHDLPRSCGGAASAVQRRRARCRTRKAVRPAG
jgi:MFS family permease